MNLCNCLQCNTNNCPAAKEFNDLQKQSNAQLDELRRISEALGTNDGHSSVTHIEILKEENATLRGLLGRAAITVKWGINDEYDKHAKGAAAGLLQEINAALKEEGK